MLISLHLPKTAGSSFARTLSDFYGEDLLKDYNDLPLHKPQIQRQGHALLYGVRNYFKKHRNVKCIHGHFLPLKYRFTQSKNPLEFVTWMREPAERLASQYYYMKRRYTPERAESQPLLKRLIEENWSLERFCLGSELKNTYSQYLWGFPLDRFDFIGIVEHYETELEYFSNNFLGKTLKQHKVNVNESSENRSYFKDYELKEKVLKHHAKDVSLYKKAVEVRLKRIK